MTSTPPGDEFANRIGGEYLTASEQLALERAGYGGSFSGIQRPALVVIDVTYGFVGDDPDADVAAAAQKYPLASGRSAWEALPSIDQLVQAARDHSLPIVFTRPSPAAARPSGGDRWSDKNRRKVTAPHNSYDILADSGYMSEDLVLEKEAPSALFGTPLARWLFGWHVDGVVLCGGTTSGCVRASAVDAFSYNLKVEVASDATFDRVMASHQIALFDLSLKYADVRTTHDIILDWRSRDFSQSGVSALDQ
jgi:maleamate amidohydrolase